MLWINAAGPTYLSRYLTILHYWFLAHMKSVRSVLFSLEYEWLMSCGNDKYFQWHCTKSGARLGGFAATAVCTCLQYPFRCLMGKNQQNFDNLLQWRLPMQLSSYINYITSRALFIKIQASGFKLQFTTEVSNTNILF